MKNNLIDSDSNMFLTIDSLIQINNLVRASNNITLRKVSIKPYEFNKIYMDRDLIIEYIL